MRLKRQSLFSFLAVVLPLVSSAPALADDGGISFGGTPHLLGSHATVSMQNELVKMEIGEKVIKVDCLFTFHNKGPACKVRVGFPDQGEGAAEPYQGEDKRPSRKNLKATFISYESWVDGKLVPTTLLPTADRTLYWHAKTVTFKAHGDTYIRDLYSLPPGAQMTSENGLYQQTSYVLHTGSSWRGPIGHAEIFAKFDPKVVPAPLQIKSLNELPGHDLMQLKWSTLPKGTVVYSGPAKPTLKGDTLRFVRSNFKPGKDDDVHVFYGFHLVQNGQ